MTDLSTRSLNSPPKTSLWQRRLWGLRFLFQPLETIEARTQAYGDDYQVTPPDANSALVYCPNALVQNYPLSGYRWRNIT
ncbi:MAG: hypothetical protein LH679_13570 [Cyanobacteria bacterium CAN_BIN43]|nr:hypothetical protein [Cyanobacteria bacterium CAN_BIN43]